MEPGGPSYIHLVQHRYNDRMGSYLSRIPSLLLLVRVSAQYATSVEILIRSAG